MGLKISVLNNSASINITYLKTEREAYMCPWGKIAQHQALRSAQHLHTLLSSLQRPDKMAIVITLSEERKPRLGENELHFHGHRTK